MIQLTEDSTATPVVYSEGDGTNPITAPVTTDGTGGTVTGTPTSDIFVWADNTGGDIDNYSGISLSLSGSDTGITWELSADNTTFASSINLSDLDVSLGYQTTQIYARATVLNDGSVTVSNYTTADVELTATANPA